jgi:hypothetical protein
MKKSVFNIGSIYLILGLCLISIEDKTQDIKLLNKERKEARKADMVVNYEALGIILGNRKFVFEADYEQELWGEKIPVPPMFNFIRVDSTSVSMQFGDIRYSYLEGRTNPYSDGVISQWNLYKNEKQLNYTIEFRVFSTGPVERFTDFIMFINNDKSVMVKASRGKSNSFFCGHIKPIDKPAVSIYRKL